CTNTLLLCAMEMTDPPCRCGEFLCCTSGLNALGLRLWMPHRPRLIPPYEHMSSRRHLTYVKFGTSGALVWVALIALVAGLLTPSAVLLAVAATCVGLAVV